MFQSRRVNKLIGQISIFLSLRSRSDVCRSSKMPYKEKKTRANYMRDYRRKKAREKMLAEQAAASARRQVPLDDSDSDMEDTASKSSADSQDPVSIQPEMSIPDRELTGPQLMEQPDETAHETAQESEEAGGETYGLYEHFGSARNGK